MIWVESNATVQDSTAQLVPDASEHCFQGYDAGLTGLQCFLLRMVFCYSLRGALRKKRWTPNFERAELTENESAKPCPCMMSLNRGIGL
jgi:hypothetical protein